MPSAASTPSLMVVATPAVVVGDAAFTSSGLDAGLEPYVKSSGRFLGVQKQTWHRSFMDVADIKHACRQIVLSCAPHLMRVV